VQAVKRAGKVDKVFVFGFDGSDQLVGFLKEEPGVLIATTAQQPVKIGETGLEAALSAIAGGKLEKTIEVPVLPLSRDDEAGLVRYEASLKEYK